MGQPVVLLVHYDPRQVRSLQGALESDGFRVHTCTDGESALKSFPEVQPDVVVLEAMIPRRNGFEVCRELKATAPGQQTPVVITSGVFRSVKHRTEALYTYGCQEFLGRGFSPADLVKAVRTLLPAGAVERQRRAPVETAPPMQALHPSRATAASHAAADQTGAEPTSFSDILAELDEELVVVAPRRPPAGGGTPLSAPTLTDPLLTAMAPESPASLLEEAEVSTWLEELFPSNEAVLAAEVDPGALRRDEPESAPPDELDDLDDMDDALVSIDAALGMQSPIIAAPERVVPAEPADLEPPEAVEPPRAEAGKSRSEPPALPVEMPEPEAAQASPPPKATTEDSEAFAEPADLPHRFELDTAALERAESRGDRNPLRATSPAPIPARIRPVSEPLAPDVDDALVAIGPDAAAGDADPVADPHESGFLTPRERFEGPANEDTEDTDEAADDAEPFNPPLALLDELTEEPWDEASIPTVSVPDLDPRAVPDIAPVREAREAVIDLASEVPPAARRARAKSLPAEEVPVPLPVIRNRRTPLSLVTLCVALAAAAGWFLYQHEMLPLDILSPLVAENRPARQPAPLRAGTAAADSMWGEENPPSAPVEPPDDTRASETAADPAPSEPESADAANASAPADPSETKADAGGPSETKPVVAGSSETKAAAAGSSETKGKTAPDSSPTNSAAGSAVSKRPASSTANGAAAAASRGPVPLTIVEADGRTVLPAKPGKPDAGDSQPALAPKSGPEPGTTQAAAQTSPKGKATTKKPASETKTGSSARTSGTRTATKPGTGDAASPKRAASTEPYTAAEQAARVSHELFTVTLGGTTAAAAGSSDPEAGPRESDGEDSEAEEPSASAAPRSDSTARIAPGADGQPVPLEQLDSRAEAVRRKTPVYPTAAKSLRIRGEVRLQVLVLESGAVGEIRVLRSPSPILSQAATSAVFTWLYRPATSNGRLVKSWTTETIVFSGE